MWRAWVQPNKLGTCSTNWYVHVLCKSETWACYVAAMGRCLHPVTGVCAWTQAEVSWTSRSTNHMSTWSFIYALCVWRAWHAFHLKSCALDPLTATCISETWSCYVTAMCMWLHTVTGLCAWTACWSVTDKQLHLSYEHLIDHLLCARDMSPGPGCLNPSYKAWNLLQRRTVSRTLRADQGPSCNEPQAAAILAASRSTRLFVKQLWTDIADQPEQILTANTNTDRHVRKEVARMSSGNEMLGMFARMSVLSAWYV